MPISALQGCSLQLPLHSTVPTKGEGSEVEHLSQLVVNRVHSIVPVDPDQELGCFHSQAMIGLHLWESNSGSVPVWLFSPLRWLPIVF